MQQQCPGTRHPVTGFPVGCTSTNFTPIPGARTVLDGVLHAIMVCDQGHRIMVPQLGHRCPNCGYQEAVRVGQDSAVPSGHVPAAGQVRMDKNQTLRY